MSTYEERLARLERWRDLFNDDERTPLRRIYEDLTIILGLHKELAPQVKAQWRDVHEIEIRLDKLENHVEALQSDTSAILKKLNTHDVALATIIAKLDQLLPKDG